MQEAINAAGYASKISWINLEKTIDFVYTLIYNKGVEKKEGKIMPNWTTSTLKFKTSTPQAIIDNYFTGEDFDFEKIIPSPRTKEECPAEYCVNEDSHIQLEDDRPWFDWYRWNVKHWGTKWGACETAYEITKSGITVVFDTAWDYPAPIFEKLIKKYGNCIEISSCLEWGERCFHYKGGKKQ